MDKITFRQFVNSSKQQLINAIGNVPVIKTEYQLYKYCTLTLENDSGEEQVIGMKPCHRLLIEWKYDSPDRPTVNEISIKHHDEIDSCDKYFTNWSPEKLNKWLARHTKQEYQYVQTIT